MDADILRPNQQAAVEALLTCPTVAAAASQAGCGARTLYRWLTDPKFRGALAEAQRNQRSEISAALRRAGLAAVDTLVGVTTDEAAATGARVSAAKALLDLMYRDVAADLEARLGNLEARLGQGDQP